ncbi:PTS transporter subunit EIIC [Enterococcus sp. LJL99]
MSKNNQALASAILINIGGKENISNVTHCMTRLRFNVKDLSKVKDKEIRELSGVLGVVQSGGQYQIIIGQTVDKVYATLMEEANFDHLTTQTSSSPDLEKEPFSFKLLGNKILDSLAGSLTPLIPILIAASMFKMVMAIFGPSMLNLIHEGTSLATLLTFVGDAGFYFFPIFLGYTASKKFGVTPVLGMFLGAILIHPTFVSLATEGLNFEVFGIPASAENYTSTVIPMILSIWVMSYIEKFLKKVIPATLSTILIPTLTIVIMLPVTLVVLGPLGFVIGEYISKFLLSLDSIGGFLAVAIIAALWQFLVMTGMHLLMITTMITVFAQNGQESLVTPAAIVSSMCVAGMCLGSFLRLKDKNGKALAFSFLAASFIGGVTEPGVYGLGVRYKKPFIGLLCGGIAGGFYAGVTGVTAYAIIPVANFACLASFFGGSSANAVNGFIACGIGFVVSAVVTYIIGVKEKEDEQIVEESLI